MDGIVGRLLFSWIANAIAIGVAVALIGSINAWIVHVAATA